MTSYKETLIAIATGKETSTVTECDRTAATADPAAFFTDLFRDLFGTATINRDGTERLMDALFAPPSVFTSLLLDPERHQADLAAAIDLDHQSTANQNYWTYIICPAWNQHADILHLMTATTTTA